MSNPARFLHIAAAAIVALGLCLPAHATHFRYGHFAWESVMKNVQRNDFESLPGNATFVGPTLNLPGATFGATNGILFSYSPAQYDIGSGKYLVGPNDIGGTPGFTFISFTTNPTGIAFDLGAYVGNPGFFDVTVHTHLSGDHLYGLSTDVGTSTFFGITSDTPDDVILSATIHTFAGPGALGPAPSTIIDNLAFGDATVFEVPLPSVAWLLLWGLGFLAVRRRMAA